MTLVTLVVDAPALDGAPRGTGVLVAPARPASGPARSRTSPRSGRGWPRRCPAATRCVCRTTIAPIDPVATATADAGILIGAPSSTASSDATFATWERAGAAAEATLPGVGETAAGTGLAAVVAQAERTGARPGRLARDSRPSP